MSCGEKVEPTTGGRNVIRIDMTQQDTRHPDESLRHWGSASCEVAGRRFQAQGPAPVYKLSTLLWLHGHSGEYFEVYDDLTPFGNPGGLAMRGKVRNWVSPPLGSGERVP